MTKSKKSRRQFLQTAGIGAGALLAGVGGCGEQSRAPVEKMHCQQSCRTAFKLGLASYSLRKFGLEETLAMTKRVGLKCIAFKSFHLSLESTQVQIKAVAAKVKEAGLELYGGGVIYMRSEADVHRAFDYAKTAGMKVIIGVPKPRLLGLVNEKVQDYNISVAIHNHGPGDKVYPTPETIYEKIHGLDNRIGLCLDIGHTKRAGVDPSEAARSFADRLLDVHIKDVSAATAEGKTLEIGRGVIDIPRFVRTLLKIRYAGIVAFEYEKDPNDPLAGLAESVGYVRGILAAV